MFHPLRLTALGLALASCLGATAQGAPPDRDYETVAPAPRPAATLSASNPAGFATSPLALADAPSASRPRMRFVLRDGSVLVGEVLGFDGQMYALRLPHSTILARKDFFAAVTPLSGSVARKPAARPVRAARAVVGARY